MVVFTSFVIQTLSASGIVFSKANLTGFDLLALSMKDFTDARAAETSSCEVNTVGNGVINGFLGTGGCAAGSVVTGGPEAIGSEVGFGAGFGRSTSQTMLSRSVSSLLFRR